MSAIRFVTDPVSFTTARNREREILKDEGDLRRFYRQRPELFFSTWTPGAAEPTPGPPTAAIYLGGGGWQRFDDVWRRADGQLVLVEAKGHLDGAKVSGSKQPIAGKLNDGVDDLVSKDNDGLLAWAMKHRPDLAPQLSDLEHPDAAQVQARRRQWEQRLFLADCRLKLGEHWHDLSTSRLPDAHVVAASASRPAIKRLRRTAEEQRGRVNSVTLWLIGPAVGEPAIEVYREVLIC